MMATGNRGCSKGQHPRCGSRYGPETAAETSGGVQAMAKGYLLSADVNEEQSWRLPACSSIPHLSIVQQQNLKSNLAFVSSVNGVL